MKFTWIPFYKELAEKLLQFSSDRAVLLKLIYDHREEFLAKYLHDEGGEDDLCKDIDPFTAFGIFNRNTNNRSNTTLMLKKILNIKADAPTDFKGIPILNNQKSQFFGYKSDRQVDDIQNLWNLFEKVVKKEDFEKEYNIVIKQFVIKFNITMGLFWIRPEDYLALDKKNRTYLKKQYGIDVPADVPEYTKYMEIIAEVQKKMASNKIKEKTFY